MNLVLVGLSHKTAPVEIRESLSIPEADLGEALRRLLKFPDVREALILSTCNRLEFLVAGDHVHRCIEAVKALLASNQRAARSEWEKCLYALVDRDAVQHLFRVASSLDAMVVGEPQILGQVKDAYRIAAKNRSCGTLLNKLLHHAFRASKRVRTETRIGRHAVSVSYAAVQLAKSIFESLAQKTILLIGAGEMIELAALHFVQQGVQRTLITNRTFGNAIELADKFQGEAIPFDEFRKRLVDADIVLSCTGAQNTILDADDVKRALRFRKNRPMFFIDIAVPRDVDPRVNQLENAYLYDIDDLQAVVDSNMENRRQQVAKAEHIIDHEVSQFLAWTQSLEATPTIKEIRAMAEDIRRRELDRTVTAFGTLDDRQRKALDAMSKAIVNKILHHPITCIKRDGGVNGQKVIVEVARKLFDLDREDQPDDEKDGQ